MLALLLEIAGFAFLALAAYLYVPEIGYIVIGGELLVVGFLVDYTGAQPRLPRFRRRTPRTKT